MKRLLFAALLWCKENYVGLIFALIVGLLSVAPHLLAWHALEDSYQGIPFMYSDNEDYYLSRIHEIADGHLLVGSPYLFEYKNALPLVPPVGEYFYIFIAHIFHLSIPNAVVFAKFLFPVVLFLLVYSFVRIVSEHESSVKNIWGAVAAGLFVTIGYDLIDYHTLFSRLMHGTDRLFLSPWVRPVNPITGALILFTFLPLVWQSLHKKSWGYPICAGIVLALSVGYIFTFGIACSIVGILILFSVWHRQLTAAKKLASILLLAIGLDTLYWLQIVPSLTGSGGGLAGRNGLLLLHTPLLNKVLLAATTLFFLLILYTRRRGIYITKEPQKYLSIWFMMSLLFGSVVALNQQIITGLAVWPYHFVQYSIPLAIVSLFISSFILLRPHFPHIWRSIVGITIFTCLLFGSVNAGTYVYAMNDFKSLQNYAPVFSWLNTHAEKDCVVLVSEDQNQQLSGIIPAFTSCNVYSTGNLSGSIPMDRVLHSMFVEMRLRGVSTSTASKFLTDNETLVRAYLFKDWLELLDSRKSGRIQAMTPDLTKKYMVFMETDFEKELKNYRIDYVISRGYLNSQAQKSLPDLHQVYISGSTTIYKFK